MRNHDPKYLTLAYSQTLLPIGLCLTHYIAAMLVFFLKHVQPFPCQGLCTQFCLCLSVSPQLLAWLAAHASALMSPP